MVPTNLRTPGGRCVGPTPVRTMAARSLAALGASDPKRRVPSPKGRRGLATEGGAQSLDGFRSGGYLPFPPDKLRGLATRARSVGPAYPLVERLPVLFGSTRK